MKLNDVITVYVTESQDVECPCCGRKDAYEVEIGQRLVKLNEITHSMIIPGDREETASFAGQDETGVTWRFNADYTEGRGYSVYCSEKVNGKRVYGQLSKPEYKAGDSLRKRTYDDPSD